MSDFHYKFEFINSVFILLHDQTCMTLINGRTATVVRCTVSLLITICIYRMLNYYNNVKIDTELHHCLFLNNFLLYIINLFILDVGFCNFALLAEIKIAR